jgi:hypothetical protein
MECFPGIAIRFFVKLSVTIPVAPIIIIIIRFLIINVSTLQPWTNFKDNTVNINLNTYNNKVQAHSVAVRFMVWVCGMWLPAIAGSNPSGVGSVVLFQVEFSATG